MTLLNHVRKFKKQLDHYFNESVSLNSLLYCVCLYVQQYGMCRLDNVCGTVYGMHANLNIKLLYNIYLSDKLFV